ncbi:MAG: hypothetical protein SPL52_01755 [Fibrobacter sp.]|nr:hypothetical protein [Fibrobacter sp.]
MKKITLSAAIMALAMMGCSDAGLDNSVASTSEVKNTQDQTFLAKSGDESCVDATGGFGIDDAAASCGGYRAWISSTKDRMSGGGYAVRSHAAVYRETGTGGIDYSTVVKADIIGITVCGTNCRLSGNDVVCDELKGPFRISRVGANKAQRVTEYSCGVMYDGDGHGMGVYGNRVGVVSTYAVIVDAGTNHSKTLMATTANGFFGNDEVASRLYWKYIHNYPNN